MPSPYTLSGLYVITDAQLQASDQLRARVRQALEGGARLVQYRDKSSDQARRLEEARQLVRLCSRYQVPLIVNDDVELARAVAAQGVHLGRDDPDPVQARQQLGKQAIIGISCYNDWSRATAAADAGADYIAFGRFFASASKPDAAPATLDLLQRARQQLSLPVAAIGGISADNGGELLQAGASMLAVIRGVFADPDITAAVRRYAALFQNKDKLTT